MTRDSLERWGVKGETPNSNRAVTRCKPDTPIRRGGGHSQVGKNREKRDDKRLERLGHQPNGV